MAVQSELNVRLCSTNWLPQHDIPEINNRRMEGNGKVPENEKGTNFMSTIPPRGFKRLFSTVTGTQVQTATPYKQSLASKDGTSYVDSREKNPEGIPKAMQDEILELKKDVARKHSGSN